MYLLLLVFWIIFNGRITVEVIIFGIVLCGLLYWFMCKYMDYSPKREGAVLRRIPGIFVYIFILIKEILRSNWAVIKIILSPRMEMEPVFVEFTTDLRTDLARVTLANSITLTPGTYTIQLKGNTYLVHGIHGPLVEGIGESKLVKQLRKLEG